LENRGRVSDRTPDQFLVLALDSLEGCPALRVEHGCRPGQGWSGDQTPPFKPRSPRIIGLATYCNRCRFSFDFTGRDALPVLGQIAGLEGLVDVRPASQFKPTFSGLAD